MRLAFSLSVAVLALSGLISVAAPGALAAGPVASFSVAPAAPLTGDVITFTSQSSGEITALEWDLDADGQYNDASGTTARRAFATPGRYLVSLRASGPGGTATQSQWVVVGNRPPVASFTFAPGAPLTGDVVNFAAAARDPDGSIATIGWDLNGDGIFTDASGPVASVSFSAPGAYRVGIAVTDSNGATVTAFQGVAVAARPPTMLQPFPIVRLTTRSTRRGAQVLLLGVQAPPGSRVAIRCLGRSCGARDQVRLIRTSSQPLRFPALQRRMRAGVVLEIRITAPGKIGKYTRFRLRRAKPPSRIDGCLAPGQTVPTPCPPG